MSAVSLALRKPAALPEQTVNRVRRAAQALNYRPDPALSALSAYRTGQRIRRDFAVLALISNWPSRNDWLQRQSAQKLLEGASARANALGYHLEHFWARENGASPQRLSRILVNRGIRGIILAPFEHPEARFDLEWGNFSVVSIERPAAYAHFHHIVPNYFADMLLVWEQLRQRGYRRIGLVVDDRLAERVTHQWEAAHNFEQSRAAGKAEPVPTLLMGKAAPPSLAVDWVRRHRPEVIICRSDSVFRTLVAAGVRVPADVGYVSLNIIDDARGVSGILQLRDVMGAAAVDALNGLLMVGHRGPNAFSQGTQVDGVWHLGYTLRPRARTALLQ